MHEIDAHVAIVTETWFQDSNTNDTTVDLAGQHGLDMFTLNRQNVAANGRQYGGVAILTRCSTTSTKRLDVPKHSTGHRADACLDYVADVVSEAKRQFDSPLLTVAGDVNQWPVAHVLQEHPDLSEVEHGPTCGGRKMPTVDSLSIFGAHLSSPILCRLWMMASVGLATTLSHILNL